MRGADYLLTAVLLLLLVLGVTARVKGLGVM